MKISMIIKNKTLSLSIFLLSCSIMSGCGDIFGINNNDYIVLLGNKYKILNRSEIEGLIIEKNMSVERAAASDKGIDFYKGGVSVVRFEGEYRENYIINENNYCIYVKKPWELCNYILFKDNQYYIYGYPVSNKSFLQKIKIDLIK